ncbi:hypothetical protein [Rufibacter soli]|jgi:hypothetical protein
MKPILSFFIAACATVLFGCRENKTVQDTKIATTQAAPEHPVDVVQKPEASAPDTVPAQPGQAEAPFTVDVMNGYVEEFAGCACYFSRNQQEFAQEKYIYFNDYQQKALISVNGVRIPLAGAAQSDSLTLRSPYKDPKGRYEVRVTIKKSQQTGDEVAQKTGVLHVKDLKTGQTQTLPFVGECGC